MYIEAARAYGASDFRIIFQYLIPRMIPLLIPGLVSSGACLRLPGGLAGRAGPGRSVLPTWGKIINDAATTVRSTKATITGSWNRPSC